MHKNDFDEFLKTRYVADAPSNLANRIIDASRVDAVKERGGLFDGLRAYMQDFGQLFVMPQPALVFSSLVLLIAGASVLGIMNLPSADMPSDIYEMYAESDDALAFYVDDIFEVAGSF